MNTRRKPKEKWSGPAKKGLEYQEQAENMVSLYETGLSKREISERLHCNIKTVSKYLKLKGICGKKWSEKRKTKFLEKGGHFNHWKGGRTKISGYILIWNPTYPKANAVGYVLEHVLIWEQEHGSLPEGFIVHHLNGVKDDNRIENLVAMSRKEHVNQTEPYRRRIKELEAEIESLRYDLSTIWEAKI